MLEESGIMRFEINKLKESVESAITNKADASVQAETVSSELARISSEIETLKEGIRTLPLLQEVHGSPPKAKKKKK
jgi:FtsZ-binding cell division protein ZapB